MDQTLKKMMDPEYPEPPRDPAWDDHSNPENRHEKRAYHFTLANGQKLGVRIQKWERWGKRRKTFRITSRQSFPRIKQDDQAFTYLVTIVCTPANIEAVYKWFDPPPTQVYTFQPCNGNVGQTCEICAQMGM